MLCLMNCIVNDPITMFTLDTGKKEGWVCCLVTCFFADSS